MQTGRARALLAAALVLACLAEERRAIGESPRGFANVDFDPPIDPSRPVVLGGSVVYVGPTRRVRATGPIHVVRDGTPLRTTASAFVLRPRDRLESTSVAGEFSIASTDARGRVESTVEGSTVVPSLRIDGASATSVCPYAPSLDSEGDVASVVRFDMGVPSPSTQPTRLTVRDPDGTIRRDLVIDDDVDEFRVVTDPRVRPSDDRGAPVVASLGDAIELESTVNGVVRARLEVGGGRCEARRIRVSIHIVSAEPGALPPAGATRTATEENVRAMLDDAGRVLGACGIAIDVGTPILRVLAPPPTYRIAIAEGDGLPAYGGGAIRFRADGLPIAADTHAGDRPGATARRVASALRDAGLTPEIVELPRLERAADSAVDVIVRRSDGELATLEPIPGTALSTDRRQTLAIARVEFADGLEPTDADRARTGSLEERALLGGVVDTDPRTIDVVVVEAFTDRSRTGEAFVPRDRSPFVGTVVLDRRAISHHEALLTLPHEIAHVLLDDPFHPPSSTVGRFARVMGGTSGLDVDLPRTFTREECGRVRVHGEAYFQPSRDR